MDWTAHLSTTSQNLAQVRALAPDTAKAFNALSKAALTPGDVDLRHKEMICIAIAIAKQCDDCIGYHVKAAHQAGVTRAELAEVIAVAVYMGGGPSFMYGAKVLEAFDQLAV